MLKIPVGPFDTSSSKRNSKFKQCYRLVPLRIFQYMVCGLSQNTVWLNSCNNTTFPVNWDNDEIGYPNHLAHLWLDKLVIHVFRGFDLQTYRCKPQVFSWRLGVSQMSRFYQQNVACRTINFRCLISTVREKLRLQICVPMLCAWSDMLTMWNWQLEINIVLWIWENQEVMLNNMLSPTCMPNLVTLAWKRSPGITRDRLSKRSIMRIFN